MRRREDGIHCEPIDLGDGSVVYVHKRRGVEVAESDLIAIRQFNDVLKCHTCTQRDKCVLYGCARIELKGENDGVD